MGTDIHVHVEYKEKKVTNHGSNNQPIYENGEWKCGDDFREPYSFSTHEIKTIELVPDELSVGRSYEMFAVLADVRNDFENAVMCPPRGLPDDVTKEVQLECERWGNSCHSHSYFTLKELIDYQKIAPPTKVAGMLSPKDLVAFDEKGIIPNSWCMWTNIPGHELREWETECPLGYLIQQLKKKADALGVIPIWQWEEDPEGAYRNTENIRIVFWFDN
ncbi:hypothetical protein GPJ56_003598 [Histomonas meleagridis]|uniref:Uncharacterized protein n=1 Tax=Histomonas meleagridis TaxID=135588 RepID=UPI003559F440|nr:hypothetical protein GPJ56_003598 [Histomonas meleagridis]KAH0800668.1 Uncharacterized protein GO595_006421 [Histomonas meleagridis]